MTAVITRTAEVAKWAALGLTVMAFVLLLAALLGQFSGTLQGAFFYSGLASGGLAVVVTGFAILTNLMAWAARRQLQAMRPRGRRR